VDEGVSETRCGGHRKLWCGRMKQIRTHVRSIWYQGKAYRQATVRRGCCGAFVQ
jgi:hypothetical protein